MNIISFVCEKVLFLELTPGSNPSIAEKGQATGEQTMLCFKLVAVSRSKFCRNKSV